ADRHLAFVPPELLKKLDELQKRPAPGPVLVSANYQGKVHEKAVDVTAQFDVYCPTDKNKLTIPLGGVELGEGAFLDGAPVQPVAMPKAGYQLSVRGKGMHRLSMTFSVRPVATNDGPEVRFVIPKLAQSELDLLAPAQFATQVHSSGLGEEK